MKVTLVGGPLDMDGKEIEIDGGSHVAMPVKYKNPTYLGTKLCEDTQCPEYKKHYVENWKSIFTRTYELRRFKEGEILAFYMGES